MRVMPMGGALGSVLAPFPGRGKGESKGGAAKGVSR
jgi:hypothetical protein